MTETELIKTDDPAEIEDDENLDNFFAKKDKSKKPKKGKKKNKSDETVTGTKSEKQAKGQGDDWNDFEEEKEKDYSNLKIASLQVGEETEEKNEEEDGEEGDEEDGGGKKKADGKWNVPTSTPSQPEAEAVAPSLPGTQNVVGGKYVPPSVKRSNMMAMGQKTSRKPMSAPDIQSKAAFPTLSAANQDLSSQNKQTDFEAVKRGVKTTEARVDEHPPGLALGNRYGSLCN